MTANPQVIGVRANRPHAMSLLEAVKDTKAVATLDRPGTYEEAMAARGHSFVQMAHVFKRLSEARPNVVREASAKRIGVMNVGGLAPGMNPTARAVVRLGVDQGHDMVGIQGLPGLIEGDLRDLTWGDVEGWEAAAGANLGTRRSIPGDGDLYAVARSIETHSLDGIVIIGGFQAYRALSRINAERKRFPALSIPIVVLPASLDNNLPGLQMAVGADSALNVDVQAVDRIKQSATASKQKLQLKKQRKKLQ